MFLLYDLCVVIVQKDSFFIIFFLKNGTNEIKMNNRKPQRFDLSLIRDALAQSEAPNIGLHFNNDFAVLQGSGAGLFGYMINRKGPFLINDYRIGLLEQGEIHARINLIDRHVKAGMLAYVGPGTIVEPLSASSDFFLRGVALFKGLPSSIGRMPALFNGTVRDIQMPLDEAHQAVVRKMLEGLWLLAHDHSFCREAFDAQVAALLQYYHHLYSLDAERKVIHSHATDIFNRFIQLVNSHVRQEHKLSYYADRMCITQRYLGSVVHEVSGATAKEWIDRALVTEAKVVLKHSDKSVAQIAEELNFPSPSFFSKYFRRLTGLTPAEYRLG